MDAVSEFKLQTGALSSQYGNTQTALTNFGMKSGTNAYHGTRLLVPQRTFPQRELLGEQRSECPQDGSKENNFGGTVGGPIWKDRTFFFFSMEYERQTIRISGLPTEPCRCRAFKNGDFSQLLDPAFTQDAKSGSQLVRWATGS